MQNERLFANGFLEVGLGGDLGQEFDPLARVQQSVLDRLLLFPKVESWELQFLLFTFVARLRIRILKQLLVLVRRCV